MNLTLDSKVSDTHTNISPYLKSYQKRFVDILGASIGLVIGLPIFLVACAIVYTFDHVPPIFKQERLGYKGQGFQILKLRTLPIIETSREVNPQRIQQKPNYATTRTGKFWRVHSIDEIIQFWQVLRGEMSLVGHRPIPMYYLPHLAEMDGMNADKAAKYIETVSQFRPGMTCLRSINGRGNMSLQAKMAYDLDYARRASLWLDIQILLKTLYVVWTMEGAR